MGHQPCQPLVAVTHRLVDQHDQPLLGDAACRLDLFLDRVPGLAHPGDAADHEDEDEQGRQDQDDPAAQ
ncbi:hypothetical protein [Thauera humireducens]|uniref:hypothetical protein n=1 Tax=Thauera humireducens TaxID=1134435 RepID=UPI00311E4B15